MKVTCRALVHEDYGKYSCYKNRESTDTVTFRIPAALEKI